MRSSLMTKLVGFLAVVSLSSVAFAGLPPAFCQNNSDSVSSMLSRIHKDAYEVRDSADHLRLYNHAVYMSGWEIDGYNLANMRHEINQMDQTLQRLRSDETALPKNEDVEINRITPAVTDLTDTTQAAIGFFNNNKVHLWLPQYRAYLGEMYNEADRVERFTGKAAIESRGAEKGLPSGNVGTSGNGS